MTTWDFPSKSDPAKTYVVTHADSGVLACTCRGWTMKKRGQPRECTHIAEIIARYGLVRKVRGDYIFAAHSVTESAAIALDALTPAGNESIIKTVREGAMATATAATATGTLDCMKASAMTEGKFGHILDADGYVIPSKFDKVFGDGAWVMDEKLDGHRCLITKAGDTVSTTLRSIPSLPPHIVAAMLPMPDGVYDGELVVPGGVSTDVPNLAFRNELTFVMFDLLELAGQSLVGLPLKDRRDLLVVAGQFTEGNAVVVVAQTAPSWAEVERIWANGGEGAIVKKLSSRYRSGRSADWLKVKRLEQHTVTVTGFEAGSLGPTAVTLFRFDDGTEGRCKTLNSEELAATEANPAAFIGRRLVVQCQQRMRGSKSPRHPMWLEWDHMAGDGE